MSPTFKFSIYLLTKKSNKTLHLIFLCLFYLFIFTTSSCFSFTYTFLLAFLKLIVLIFLFSMVFLIYCSLLCYCSYFFLYYFTFETVYPYHKFLLLTTKATQHTTHLGKMLCPCDLLDLRPRDRSGNHRGCATSLGDWQLSSLQEPLTCIL